MVPFRVTVSFSILAVVMTLFSAHCQSISGGFTINRDLYTLRWDVFGPFITFKVIARGTGYLGFGISPKGTLEGADLFITGRHDNGTIYANDAHGQGEKDATNNYMLLFLRQSNMYTEIHFRRPLHTGDCKEDIRIMNEPQYVIWLIGPPGDVMEFPEGVENRGNVMVNLLNPPMFHSYYSTNGTMGMDNMEGCMEMGGGGGEAAKPAEQAAEKQHEMEEDATLI